MQDLCSKLCRSQQLQRLISRKMKRPIFLRGKKNVIELVFNYSFGSCCSVTKSCLTICNPMANTLATWCKELTHRKRPWCWKGLRAGGERDDRGWDGWMASSTPLTWVWVDSRSWWWTGRAGELRFMGSQRVGHDWVTELNWTYAANRNNNY